MINKIVIATRKSLLAMWQAEYVAARIRERYPETAVELLGGDRRERALY